MTSARMTSFTFINFSIKHNDNLFLQIISYIYLHVSLLLVADVSHRKISKSTSLKGNTKNTKILTKIHKRFHGIGLINMNVN